ncbi:hypothetical protein RI517_09545 [Aeromonas dhakensis]
MLIPAAPCGSRGARQPALTFIGIKQGMLTADGVDCVGRSDCGDTLGVTAPPEWQAAAERVDYPSLLG